MFQRDITRKSPNPFQKEHPQQYPATVQQDIPSPASQDIPQRDIQQHIIKISKEDI